MTRISTYADAGVDRKLEEESVNALLAIIKNKSSYQTTTTGDGMFAGSIEIGDMILSMTTDGVGTKVLLADELGIYDTIGIDCVAMNVNDLLASGSLPVAFVDYIAIREPNSDKISEIVEGIVEGCNQSNIPLIGGETAILPEIIQGPENHFDLAGTALGIGTKGNPIISSNIVSGDAIIGISSSGVHSNGLTLARKLVNNNEIEEKKELLIPTRIYVNCIKELVTNNIPIHGMAHITGGGLRNLLRLGNYHFDLQSWVVPQIFNHIKERGNIDDQEMYSTFNMGIGYVVILPHNYLETTLALIQKHFPAYVMGEVKSSKSPLVTMQNMVFGGEII